MKCATADEGFPALVEERDSETRPSGTRRSAKPSSPPPDERERSSRLPTNASKRRAARRERLARKRFRIAEIFDAAEAVAGVFGPDFLERMLLYPDAGLTLLEARLSDLIIRRELLPDGTAWLDDVEAERVVLSVMWAGVKPPEELSAADFSLPFHKFLFDFIRSKNVKPEDGLDADIVIAMCLKASRGPKALTDFFTREARRQALGPVKVEAIDAIEHAPLRAGIPFHFACDRVHKFAVKRRAHHRVQRLATLLEQTNADPKELWREHRGIGELLTELTGSDGKVDGW